MGAKGDKLSNDAGLIVELFIERLSNISGITSKKMFGGYGVFHGGKMFGLVNSKGEIYLKSGRYSCLSNPGIYIKVWCL